MVRFFNKKKTIDELDLKFYKSKARLISILITRSLWFLFLFMAFFSLFIIITVASCKSEGPINLKGCYFYGYDFGPEISVFLFLSIGLVILIAIINDFIHSITRVIFNYQNKET